VDVETTRIPPRGRFSGKLETPGHVILEGRLEGQIHAGERVTVTQSGVAVAEIFARRVEVSGVVIGNVTADEGIAVLAGARVVGDLRAPEVMVDSAATLDGRVDRIPAAPMSSTKQTLQQIVGPLVRPGAVSEAPALGSSSSTMGAVAAAAASPPPPDSPRASRPPAPQRPRLASRVRMTPKRP
jgi:cytoskeletal protein CcmA (bactofilin family)